MPAELRSVSGLQRAAHALGRILGSRVRRVLRTPYERLLDVLSGGVGIPWEINGETYRIDPRYRNQLAHDYEAAVAGFLHQRIRSGDTCFDIGANVGAYVLQMARWSSPGGRVFAFEPGRAARDVLRRHVAMNGLDDRVVVIPEAVSAAPGTAHLYAAGTDGMARLAVPNPLLGDTARPLEVPLTSVDAYCAAASVTPDWMVIDVEGLEADVLMGAAATIASGQLRGIVVEFHPSTWPRSGTGGMPSVLERLGLCVTPLTGQRDVFDEHGAVFLERR